MKILANLNPNILTDSSHTHCSCCRQSLVILLFLLFIGNLLLCPSSLRAQSSSTPSDSSGEKYMSQGLSAFRRGAFEQAVLDWKEAARLFEK
jgi:hypothetical protein